MPQLTVIVASTRPGRAGRAIGDWFVGAVPPQIGFDVRLVDLQEVALPLLDEPHEPHERRYVHEHTRRWSRTIDASDAFVLVTPEYNRGFTAPLKNALDYLYEEWHHKPVGFVSYGMTSAGLRAVELLKPVLGALRMVPVDTAVSVPLRQRLDPDGVLRPDAAMTAAAGQMVQDLRDLADCLAPLRAEAVAS